jgi:branched-chain amino acid aminotransferase
MSEIVYLNGCLLPANQARISVQDHGFLYGFGLFETMRGYNGKVLCLERHLNRLKISAEFLGISVDIAELKDAVDKTIVANGFNDARIRITVSAGKAKNLPESAGYSRTNVLVTVERYHPYPQKVYRRGFRAVISSIRRNSQSPITRLKTANYLECLLARRQALDMGADEAIFLNDKGLIAEASISNIFLISEGVLRTPDEDSGILPGITRKLVLEIASRLGIKTREEGIGPSELFEAQEAFLTNSLIEVMPLTLTEGRPIAAGEPGILTRKIMAAYREILLTS